LVPVLYQTIQQIELNNVTAVIQVIVEFYIVLPDPEIYLRGLKVSTIRVAVSKNPQRSNEGGSKRKRQATNVPKKIQQTC
jgi:hypothetical protein